MEIEIKYLVKKLPEGLSGMECHHIEQAYISTEPVIRIRREDDLCYLTCKGKGMLEREECNIPMSPESYERLLKKTEGIIIVKDRYLVPLGDGHTAELDIFHGRHEGLIIVEIEFESRAEAEAYTVPDWFGEDVTYNASYKNSTLSKG